MSEFAHINKYFIRTMEDVKTLDIKILELKEDPSNLELLYDVLCMIIEHINTTLETGSEQEHIKDFDMVNYILANALKADQINALELGLVV